MLLSVLYYLLRKHIPCLIICSFIDRFRHIKEIAGLFEIECSNGRHRIKFVSQNDHPIDVIISNYYY